MLVLSGRRGGGSEFVPVTDAPARSLWQGRSGAHSGEFLEVVRDGSGVPSELVLSSYHFGRAPYAISPG